MSETQQTGYVKTTLENHIATIEFFHPQSNSLPGSLLQQIANDIESAGNNTDVLVIVLQSAGGKAFCAGASFNELVAITTEEEGLQFFSGFGLVINAIRKSPVFVIARVQGKCVGGGVGIAAAADYTIALDGADIKLSELAIGIGPFVIGPAVERKIGASAFSQLAIDAVNWRKAEWAARKGLYAELHDTVESMDGSIAKLAATLAQSSPEAMREMKKMFWQGTGNWDELLRERAAISGRLVLSGFTKQAIEKFKQKDR